MDDAVDFALDKALDGFMDGRYPRETLIPVAVRILEHAIRSGPQRRELSSTINQLPDVEPPAEWSVVAARRRSDATVRELVDVVENGAASDLTPREQLAVDAAMMHESLRRAARSIGMSPRNLRTLIGRAGRKLARALGKNARVPEKAAPTCAPPPLC